MGSILARTVSSSKSLPDPSDGMYGYGSGAVLRSTLNGLTLTTLFKLLAFFFKVWISIIF